MKKTIIFIISMLLAYPAFSFADYSGKFSNLPQGVWPSDLIFSNATGKFYDPTKPPEDPPPVELDLNGKTMSEPYAQGGGGDFDNFRRPLPRESVASDTPYVTPQPAPKITRPSPQDILQKQKEKEEINRKNYFRLIIKQKMVLELGEGIDNGLIRNRDGSPLKDMWAKGFRKTGYTIRFLSKNIGRIGGSQDERRLEDVLKVFQSKTNIAVPMKPLPQDIPANIPTGEQKLKQNDSILKFWSQNVQGVAYIEIALGNREVPILTPVAFSIDPASGIKKSTFVFNFNGKYSIAPTLMETGTQKVEIGKEGTEIFLEISQVPNKAVKTMTFYTQFQKEDGTWEKATRLWNDTELKEYMLKVGYVKEKKRIIRRILF